MYILTARVFRRPTVDILVGNIAPGGNTDYNIGLELVTNPTGATDPRADGLRCGELVFTTLPDQVQLDRMRSTQAMTSAQTQLTGGNGPHAIRIGGGAAFEPPTCIVARTPETVTATTTLAGDADDPEMVGVGLWSRQTAVTFQSLVVYETVWP
jgi:hypothetical protein